MSGGGIVIVFAFDPVEELQDGTGLLPADAELAERLVAEHRAERPQDHAGESMRYVAGSAAFNSARDALRSARDTSPPRKARKSSKAEG